MIIAENLKKVYGGDIVSVDDLSFHIHKGEIVGFVGQNGAGKTTTIKMLTGILMPTQSKDKWFRYERKADGGQAVHGLYSRQS